MSHQKYVYKTINGDFVEIVYKCYTDKRRRKRDLYEDPWEEMYRKSMRDYLIKAQYSKDHPEACKHCSYAHICKHTIHDCGISLFTCICNNFILSNGGYEEEDDADDLGSRSLQSVIVKHRNEVNKTETFFNLILKTRILLKK